METVQNYRIEFLKVHPKNNEFFDDISGQEYEQFKTSIQNEGILTPLIVAPDMTVISGHQRLKACRELGFEMVPIIIRQDIKTEDDKMVALLAANFGRTKNDEGKQRKVAVEYVKLRGSKQGRPSKSCDNRKINLTQDQIANELGVSVRTLNEMLEIERKLTPEVKDLLDGGAFTKTTASKILVKLSKEEQAELLSSFGTAIHEGTTQKQMQEYVDMIRGLENEVEGYKLKIKNAKGKPEETIGELIEEKNKLKAEKREEYERAEKYKKDLEAAKKQKSKELTDVQSAKEKLEQQVRSLQEKIAEQDKVVSIANAGAKAKTTKEPPLRSPSFDLVTSTEFYNICDAFIDSLCTYAQEIEFDQPSAEERASYNEAIKDVEANIKKIKAVLAGKKAS